MVFLKTKIRFQRHLSEKMIAGNISHGEEKVGNLHSFISALKNSTIFSSPSG